MRVTQEILLAFFEGDELAAVAVQNGSTTFYRVKRMNKDDVAELLKRNDESHEPQNSGAKAE